MTFLKNFFLLFFLFTGTFSSCQPSEKSDQNQESESFKEQNEGSSSEKRNKRQRKRHKKDRNDNENPNRTRTMPRRIVQTQINQAFVLEMFLKKLYVF